MSRAWLLMTVATLALAACTQFPDLDDTQTQDLLQAEYPELIPITPLVAVNRAPLPDIDTENARLATRLAALRGRAARIRGSVLDGAEKQRLEKGLQ